MQKENRKMKAIETYREHGVMIRAYGLASQAEMDGIRVYRVIRWGKNGVRYVWIFPDQKLLDELERKYKVDQIYENDVWLQS